MPTKTMHQEFTDFIPSLDSDRLRIKITDTHGSIFIDEKFVHAITFDSDPLTEREVYGCYVRRTSRQFAQPFRVTTTNWYSPDLYRKIHYGEVATVQVALRDRAGGYSIQAGYEDKQGWHYFCNGKRFNVAEVESTVDCWADCDWHPFLHEDF